VVVRLTHAAVAPPFSSAVSALSLFSPLSTSSSSRPLDTIELLIYLDAKHTWQTHCDVGAEYVLYVLCLCVCMFVNVCCCVLYA
jgi:hypothetical protein